MHRSSRFQNRLALLVAVGLFAGGSALAAPVISFFEGGSPAHAQAAATVLVFAEGLEAPVTASFSDGVGPNVAAADVEADLDRGLVLVRVPAGAVTGNMKISANGVDSLPYFFRIDAGTFTQGTHVVSGQVTDGVDPVEGAAVVLLKFACDDETLWDFAMTDASGDYSLTGVVGDYVLYVFPPAASGLFSMGAEVTLGPSPVTEDITLFPGVPVTGSVVLSSLPAVGVPNSRVDFESMDGGFDSMLTDSSGDFSITLAPGDYELWVEPGSGALLSMKEDLVTITGPGPQTLADVELDGGVEISGLVRRVADLSLLSNAEISVHATNSCCDPVDEASVAGDGSFSLVVPPNQSYSVSVRVDDDQPYVDLQIDDLFVDGAGLSQDFDLADAAFISGKVTDADTGSPLFDFQVEASAYPWGSGSTAWAWTCEDGSYRLRVEPSAQGYIVGNSRWEENGYVPVSWDGTQSGTLFPCLGSAIPVITAGSEVANIDLAPPPGAGAVSGRVLTQDSGCTATVAGQHWIQVDGGTDVGCDLGVFDWNASAGTYRVYGLPHSGLLPGLRLCDYNVPWDASPQCYTLNRPPGYDPVSVPIGGEVTDVDFCLGNTPVSQVSSVEVAKSGDNVFLSWDDSGDPYHDRYRLWGSMTATPGGAGSFPTDPAFNVISEDYPANALLPLSTPEQFFLVTDVGVTGAEGPAGAYGD
jgi:hypothetical protein